MNFDINTLIGMKIEDAADLINKNNLIERIVSEDGVNYMVTMDLNLNRINLSTVDGLVTKATIG